jgi:cullin-associated NEDD8-dissociated protein 1
MATSDLCTHLQRHAASSSGANIDTVMERRICTAILALLDDDSNDVQAIAVKTLGVLLTIVQEEQVLEISARLVALILDKHKKDLRDVYTIGLRTLIKTVPLSMGNAVALKLCDRLLSGVRQNDNEDIKLASLDVLTELLSRLGAASGIMIQEHEKILNALLAQLNDNGNGTGGNSPVVKKRAGVAIGCLSVVMSDVLLFRLVDTLLNQITLHGHGSTKKSKRQVVASTASEGNQSMSIDTRALIRTMCIISGSVGHRLAQQIDVIVPIFLKFCDPADAQVAEDCDDDMDMEDAQEANTEEQDEATLALANELRESCFAGFESFILRCPAEVTPHLPKLVESALAFMVYDPNYSYGDGDDDDEDGGCDEDEFEDDDAFSDEDEYSDDDDESWKLRRAAIRCLVAVVEAQKSDPSKLWTEFGVANALVKRFKERVENCRVDVILCFTKLLIYTVADIQLRAGARGAGGTVTDGDGMETSMDTTPTNATAEEDVSQDVVLAELRKFVPSIVKACEKQLSNKKGGERTKSSALSLLSTASQVPGGLGGKDQIAGVFCHIKALLQEPSGSKALKLESLALVRQILMLTSEQHQNNAHDVAEAVAPLLPELCRAVQEDWYKIIAEALLVLSEIPPLVMATQSTAQSLDPSDVASLLDSAIEGRLKAHDLDQEIKECSLRAAASLLCNLHEYLPKNKKDLLLGLILERLKNEITRVAALKTLSTIASAKNKIDMSPILEESVTELASLLRQQSRGLKQSTLETLTVLIDGHGQSQGMSSALFEAVLKETGPVVSDSDLHVSHLGLQVAVSILKAAPLSGPLVQAHIVPQALVLSTSPSLKDLALESLLALFESLVTTTTVSFSELHRALIGRLHIIRSENNANAGSKAAVSNLAKCVAAITCAAETQDRNATIRGLIHTLEGNENSVSVVMQLSLLTTGEIGERVNLSEVGDSATKLQTIYMTFLDDENEDTKAAAAYALGHAAVGCKEVFLAPILDAFEDAPQKKQYLLLSSLKEVVKCHQAAGSDLSESVSVILPHLTGHFATREDGVRKMVADCMGALCCLQPREVLPKLQELCSAHVGKPAKIGESDDISDDSAMCWTIATSIKNSIAHKPPVSLFAPHMPTFLQLLKEEDLSVKLASLLMVYSAVHHTPQLLSGHMKDEVVPSLYELAQLNLKRVVDLGPFKHTVDDALPLRKAALSIFSTSLDNCPDCIDINAFMPILAKCCEDVEDIQLQAHHVMISMCTRQPEALAIAADSFVEPLEKTMNKKKGTKAGTELERVYEWIKSALRVMLAMSQVEAIMK